MTQKQPLVDIICLVHDRADWADLCVRSVESFTKNAYRVIIVDNASVEEKTKSWLVEMEKRGHTVVHLAENRSFSNGVNAGVAVGSSRFVILLNDDAICTEGWDSALLQDAAEKTVGLAGARSNYVAGAQGNPNFIGEPPYLAFVCVAFRREIWNVIGPLDEVTFDGFSSEDLDWSWRVKKAGYKLKVSNAFVLHAGSRTLDVTVGGPEARIRNNDKYQHRLLEKWGKDWVQEHSRLDKKVLVVTYHAEEWTRVAFMGSVLGLKRSDGVGFQFFNQVRAPIHHARQLVCDYALDQGFDWLIQLDDDATFNPDVIRRLLSHNVDVVSALAYQRKPPYNPCIFEVGPDGLLGAHMMGAEHTGLRKVDVTGFHVSALKTSVIRRLREGLKDAEGKVIVPGTRQYWGSFSSKVGEDFNFSLSLKQIGIPIYCDTDLIAGHIGSSIVVDEEFRKRYAAGQINLP